MTRENTGRPQQALRIFFTCTIHNTISLVTDCLDYPYAKTNTFIHTFLVIFFDCNTAFSFLQRGQLQLHVRKRHSNFLFSRKK